MMNRVLRMIRRIAWVLAGCVILGVFAVFAIHMHVTSVGTKGMLTPEQAAQLQGVNCILVLGCGVKEDGTPSLMLKDRLECGVELYHMGTAPKLLMSGDHGQVDYDEVGTMKQYAMERDVPSSDIFMDHAGFSTYESMYRAKEVFQAEKVVIVSQQYHLYRAIYIARMLGLDAYGVAAEGQDYAGQWGRDIREILAQVKDFVTVRIKPDPTYLGDVIPVYGNGDVTND